MKKRRLLFLVVMIFSISLFSGCTKGDSSNLKTIKLNEVARSVFYAPMYAAISQGFFKEEGLNIELSTGQGADKTMQEVISGSADIGFCGPEQVIYINCQNREDYPIIFAGLTQRDGSFLVGRTEDKNFTWESLKGKTIIGGRPGGVPEMTLEFVLRNHGLTPGKDVNIITNVAYTATAGAFKAGTGDYVALFEPTGTLLEKEKAGFIVASIGESAGIIPYTCFFSTKSYMDKNSETLEKFTRAIYKGQLWIASHSDEDAAKAIKQFFPGTDEALLVPVMKNYRAINAFAPDPSLKDTDLSRLMDIIQSYRKDLIPIRPDYKKIVTPTYWEKVINK